MQETLFRCRNAYGMMQYAFIISIIALYFIPLKVPGAIYLMAPLIIHGIVFSVPTGRGKPEEDVRDLPDYAGAVHLHDSRLHNQVYIASHKEKDSKGNRDYVRNCICGRRGLSAIFGQQEKRRENRFDEILRPAKNNG